MIEFFSNPYYFWYFMLVLTILWSPVRQAFIKVRLTYPDSSCFVFYIAIYAFNSLMYLFDGAHSPIEWAPQLCWLLTGAVCLSFVIHLLIKLKKP